MSESSFTLAVTAAPKATSSSAPVIRVENVAKKYQITRQRGRGAQSLRETLTEGIRSAAGRLFGGLRGQASPDAPSREEFWALQDVSFEVRAGEAVGVIGRNGAGKSTLLKVLSRITEPTRGGFGIRGRLTSLLEVGTGFHGELTGRENVFLNGIILGMRRAEIKKQFDAIVAFAGVEQFIDTPVKRYSSGMQARLAFAVAAHLEAEVLIIDEVLAVGDMAFQRKCLGKMSELARNQRTVLFVTHNMAAMRQLCTRGIVLEAGRIVLDSSAEAAAKFYATAAADIATLDGLGLQNRMDRTSGAVRFTAFSLGDEACRKKTSFEPGETVVLRLSFRVYSPVPSLGLYCAMTTGVARETVTTVKTTLSHSPLEIGHEAALVLSLPSVQLRPGDYGLYICLGNADCTRFYDVIDPHSVSLPYLTIVSEEQDVHKYAGYFSIPWDLRIEGHDS